MNEFITRKDIQIRQFEAKDMSEVIELLQDISTYKPKHEELSELAIRFIKQGDAYSCVAVSGEEIIGFGSIFFINRIRGGRAAIIEDVVVLKSMRGRGIGKRIMKELIDCARRKKCFKINLETSNAGKQMYETLDFIESGLNLKLLL